MQLFTVSSKNLTKNMHPSFGGFFYATSWVNHNSWNLIPLSLFLNTCCFFLVRGCGNNTGQHWLADVHNISKRGGLYLRYSLTFSPGSYGKCCLGYVNDIKKKRNIVGYTMQEPNTVCNMTAVLWVYSVRSFTSDWFCFPALSNSSIINKHRLTEKEKPNLGSAWSTFNEVCELLK